MGKKTSFKSEIIQKCLGKKVVFIGVDGASKRIIDRMISENKLSTIRGLMERGSYFSSNSDTISASPVIWTSIATAKRPEKHGVMSFYGTSGNVTAKRVWEIFNDLGYPVGIFGHFLTWPPADINGFMIPDLLALDNRCHPQKYGFMWDITHSEKNDMKMSPTQMLYYFSLCLKNGIRVTAILEALQKHVKKKLGRDKIESYFNSRVVKSKFHRDLFIRLYKTYKPRYSFFHIHLVDSCSHRFWKYMESSPGPGISNDEILRHGHKIYDAYSVVDKIIKHIVDSVDSDTILVIASDHGFKTPNQKIHWMNSVILDVDKFTELFDSGRRKDINISFILPRIHLSIRNSTPKKYEYYKRVLQSIAVAEYQKPLFNIHEVDSGNIVLNFNGEIDDISRKHINLDGQIYPLEDFLIQDQGFSSGIHDADDGILILSGPDIKRNIRGRDPVTVFDIIPTILSLFNMPVGKDMDGRVITEAIEEDFQSKYPTWFIDTYKDVNHDEVRKKTLSDGETEKLKNQLRDLGYM
jgi:predicted AlkP superfamily phosphohydrolase/phosphomutase